MRSTGCPNKTPRTSAPTAFADLGGWLTFAAAMTTTLILSETAVDYLRFMYGRRPEIWVTGIIIATAALVIISDFVLVYVRTKTLRRSLADSGAPTRLALRSIKVATIATVILAIGASWLAVSLARIPKPWLTDPAAGLIAFVLTLTFVLPTIVATAICYSVASTDERVSIRGARAEAAPRR